MQLQLASKTSSAYLKGMQALADSLVADDDEKPLFEPIPNSPQERAYNCDADVLGFGGAAGGSKSWLILGKAIMKHKRTRIFRETFPSLRGLIDDGNKILSGKARFIQGSGWRFDGKIIMLGYVQYEHDWEKWKGDRVDLMAFDEADQFPESVVRNLSGWNGTTDPTQKVQRILCFNPPGIKGEWLLDYFAPWIRDDHPNPAEDGELRYYIRYDDDDIEVDESEFIQITGEELNQFYEDKGIPKFYEDDKIYTVTHYKNELLQVESRTFFKSLVDDNPYAMATGYDQRLEMMREPLKSQLRFGDFSAGAVDDEDQVIPTEWIIEAQSRWQRMEAPTVEIRATGCDPSRGGKDNFVIANMRGNYFDELIVHKGDTIPTDRGGEYGAKLIQRATRGHMPHIGIDVIGIGSSVYDSCLDMFEDVMPINSARRASGTDKSGKFRYGNLRSKMWWEFYEALNPESGLNIALPPSRILRNELRAPTYSTKTGRIQVEKKEDIKKRIGRSTDHADAVIYAWYVANHYKQRPKPRSF